MSKENGVQRFERFLPKDGETIREDGMIGMMRVVKGIKNSGEYAGEYILENVRLVGPDCKVERHALTLQKTV